MSEEILILGIVASVLSIGATIFWIVIGWRAMKAHERLAEEASRANDRADRSDADHFFQSDIEQVRPDAEDVHEPLKSRNRKYREFLRTHPEVDQLSSKERHERFCEWELEQEN